jgi:hypothetical protein
MGESGTIDRKSLLIRIRPFMYGDDVERPVNLPREGPYHCLLTATHQRCGARSSLSSRRGSGVNTERPEPEG